MGPNWAEGLGAAKPVGSRGNAPVGGPRGAKPPGPKTILALLGASISLLLDMFVAIFSMLFIQNWRVLHQYKLDKTFY